MPRSEVPLWENELGKKLTTVLAAESGRRSVGSRVAGDLLCARFCTMSKYCLILKV